MYKVIPEGGNQYLVVGESEEIVNLDGFTVIPDDVYNLLEAFGVDIPDTYISPQHHDDDYDRAAIEYVVGYTEFDITQFLNSYEGDY